MVTSSSPSLTPGNVQYSRYAEEVQTDVGVARVREWAARTGGLAEDDVFISADVDEVSYESDKMMSSHQVVSRPTLQELRWCQTSFPQLTGALWTPLGR